MKALNNEVTRLTDKKTSLAIRMKGVRAKPAAPASRARDGIEEQHLPRDALVRHLYAPCELDGDKKRRATDHVWSVTVHKIERAVVKSGELEPMLYYLMPTPDGERGLVREEPQVVPVDTEALPEVDTCRFDSTYVLEPPAVYDERWINMIPATIPMPTHLQQFLVGCVL